MSDGYGILQQAYSALTMEDQESFLRFLYPYVNEANEYRREAYRDFIRENFGVDISNMLFRDVVDWYTAELTNTLPRQVTTGVTSTSTPSTTTSTNSSLTNRSDGASVSTVGATAGSTDPLSMDSTNPAGSSAGSD
jgi:hypothetical protein